MCITNDDFTISLQLVAEMLHTQLNEPTNQISIKVPKVVKPMKKKMLS